MGADVDMVDTVVEADLLGAAVELASVGLSTSPDVVFTGSVAGVTGASVVGTTGASLAGRPALTYS